jgi:hypothetical protein
MLQRKPELRQRASIVRRRPSAPSKATSLVRSPASERRSRRRTSLGFEDLSSGRWLTAAARYHIIVDIEQALNELQGAMVASGMPLWRLPESEDELKHLEVAISPMRLPADVRHFWTQVEARSLRLRPYPSFISPASALKFWNGARDEFRSAQPMALVDVAYESHQCMSVELDIGDVQGGALFEWSVSDPGGFTRQFNGIADWLTHMVGLVRAGLYQRLEYSDGPVWFLPGPDNEELERGMRPTPAPHTTHGTALHVGGDILDWPGHWQHVNGLRQADLVPRGATHSIAEVLASPPTEGLRATIAARVTDYAGGGSWARVRVDDGTGTLNVYCPAETTLLGPRNGEWNEFDIVVAPGVRQIPVDPGVAARGIEDDVERVAAALIARYGGPAGATAQAVRPLRAPPN